MEATQQKPADIPMAMQIWKPRDGFNEVKVLWASQGKVCLTGCHTCKVCKGADRCPSAILDLATFTNAYAYVRAF